MEYPPVGKYYSVDGWLVAHPSLYQHVNQFKCHKQIPGSDSFNLTVFPVGSCCNLCLWWTHTYAEFTTYENDQK